MNDFITHKVMGGVLVRIYRVPQGRNVPLDIRAKWVGVILPVEELGVIDGSTEQYYFVDPKKALAALKRKSPKTAVWWRAFGPFKGVGFIFRVKDTMLVKTPQETPGSSRRDTPFESAPSQYETAQPAARLIFA